MSAPGFEAYLRTREAVLRMKERGADAPSRYWAEELGHIDYLIDASPLIVAKLRHHAFHITNLRPYDYRDKGDRRENFVGRLRALAALDRAGLRVPESPALGGFGFEVDGALYNVDTLKFYEVLIGMDRAGLLDPFRRGGRKTVWEVGGGWGGFAYQFKTLFPDTTYVITDFPELFLFSATYLQTAFPHASVHFAGTDGDDDPSGWGAFDFVFVPAAGAALVASARLDLAVNMVSFQEMTEAQVREYVRLAADGGVSALYSLNRERSPFNSELTSVSAVLRERFELREIEVLDTEYTTVMKKPPKAKAGERPELTYRHFAGAPRAAAGASPRIVLGMTLYNKAHQLREAIDSLLAQTHAAFTLLMLDDGSDGSDAIAREYEARDPRVRYIRHDRRRAMVATWREVVEIALRDYPSAEYFAWVSDHDRWHPEWLRTLVAELDAHPGVALAYPVTRRIDDAGREFEKGPRLFDTFGITDPVARWRHFCRHGVGSGDMVYGLMRVAALRKAGIFRRVLRPDRLLVAEMSLQGQTRQVPEVLWFRRQSGEASVNRQSTTLFLPGEEPPGFSLPPWLQHARLLRREYIDNAEPPLRLPPRRRLVRRGRSACASRRACCRGSRRAVYPCRARCRPSSHALREQAHGDHVQDALLEPLPGIGRLHHGRAGHVPRLDR